MNKSKHAAERQALVELHHRCGGDSVRLWKHLDAYGSAHTALRRIPRQASLIQKSYAHDDPFSALVRSEARAITWLDVDYPALLLREKHYPPVLYVRGEFQPQDACAVAIVGSRRATRWARRLAFEIARDLAALGVTIVSGLAAGVDAAAHAGALETGRTIAVTGCGIDRTYPANHTSLSQRIAEQGAVVSQFPVGSPPIPRHFPMRNDTIVRLVLGVVVVEAPEKSGAILTAHCALDRNVELLVCPGDAGRPSCRGSNRLLKKKGTAVVESAMDVLEALRLEGGLFSRVGTQSDIQTGAPDWINAEPRTVEEMAQLSGLSIASIRAELTELELMEKVVRLEGDRYRLLQHHQAN